MNAHLCKARQALLLCCFLGILPKSYSQTHTTTYTYPDDLKGYSATMVTDGAYETLFAGTIYNFNGTGRNAVHLWRNNGIGFPSVSVFFDNPTWSDLRAVSIIGDGDPTNAVYTIVCLYRSGVRGSIALINVDKSGTYLGGVTIRGTQWSVGQPIIHKSYFPTHAIRHSNGSIYISGYYMADPLNPAGEPDYLTDKEGFIMKYTPGDNTFACGYVNTKYATPDPTYSYDYDIAMRVVETNAHDVFVTGGVNNCYYAGLPSIARYLSATMNLFVQPNLTKINDDHFATRAGDRPAEFGTGLIEDVPNNRFFVLGNNYFWDSSNRTSFPFHANIPYQFTFTRINNSAGSYSKLPTSIDSRIEWGDFNSAWSMQSLPSGRQPVPGQVQTIIAGFQNGIHPCKGRNFSSKDSVSAFLYDVGLGIGAGITQPTVINPARWTSFVTQIGYGTGAYATSNSYYKLGGGVSNVAWNPTFAARFSANTDIIFTAPRWQPGSPDRLSIKSVRASAIPLEDPTCPGSFYTVEPYPSDTCFGPGQNAPVEGLGGAGTPSIVTKSYIVPSHAASIQPISGMGTGPYGFISYAQCSPSTPHYREEATGVNETGSNETTKIYPNPAQDQVRVVLANNIAENAGINISLVNIYGQVIAKLYAGIANALPQSLSLRNLTPGVYIVQVSANGKMQHQERLIIQP